MGCEDSVEPPPPTWGIVWQKHFFKCPFVICDFPDLPMWGIVWQKIFIKGFFIQHDPMRMGGKWIKHLLQKWFSILKAIMWFFEIHSATIWFQKHYNESEFCDIWQIITCARYWYWMTFEMLSSRGNWDLIDFLRPPRKYIFGSLLPPHLLCDNHI